MHNLRHPLPRRAALFRVQSFLPSRRSRGCLPGLRAANPAQRSVGPGGVAPTRNPGTVLIHSHRERGRDMTPCSHRAWTTPCGLPTCPHPTDYDYDGSPPHPSFLSRPSLVTTVAPVEAASRLGSASFGAPVAFLAERQL